MGSDPNFILQPHERITSTHYGLATTPAQSGIDVNRGDKVPPEQTGGTSVEVSTALAFDAPLVPPNRMARLPRYAAPGMAQHIIQRGNNRVAIFAAKSDYRFFLECLGTASREHGCRVHAYVLMTNHVHILATPSAAASIPLVMQDVGRRYVRRFNDSYGRSGTLWEGRYRATLIDTQQYFLTCQRYIDLNPVRAGLASRAVDYPWSSYRFNAHGGRDTLVSLHDCYRALGVTASERRRAYRVLCASAIPDSVLAEIRDATNRRWALGTRSFRDECAKLLGRRVEPAPRGRRPRQVASPLTQQNDEIRI